jgi:hypothetical protein
LSNKKTKTVYCLPLASWTARLIANSRQRLCPAPPKTQKGKVKQKERKQTKDSNVKQKERKKERKKAMLLIRNNKEEQPKRQQDKQKWQSYKK